MQRLARQGLTDDQVRALLTCDAPSYASGLDLLDTSNKLVRVLSDVVVEADGSLAQDPDGALVSGSVSWDNRNPIRASCRVAIQTELAWGRDRVRPWMIVKDMVSGALARFDFPPFVMSTPDENRGEDPVTWDVTGYDLLSLLQTGPADTYVCEAYTNAGAATGLTYLAAVRDVVAASGLGVAVLLDGTSGATVIPATRTWVLTDPIPSWLRIITELLAAINYVAPFIDETGALHSYPAPDPTTRPVDWPLDTTDERTNIVGEQRTLTISTGDIANWWRFVNSRDLGYPPTAGDGMYTPPINASDGPASLDALGGHVNRKFVRLDAADQASLVAQGDKIVAQDKAAVKTTNLLIDPLPVQGFADVFLLTDGGITEKLGAASWTVNLDGSPGPLQLGGAPPEPTDPVDGTATATITRAAPLRVVVDGATVDSFANALDGAVYAVGARVQVTVRNPQPPLIAGKETTGA